MQKDEFPWARRSCDCGSDKKELDRRIYNDEEGVYTGEFSAERDAEEDAEEHEWPSDCRNALPENDFEELGWRVASERRYHERQERPGKQAIGDECRHEEFRFRIDGRLDHDPPRRYWSIYFFFFAR